MAQSNITPEAADSAKAKLLNETLRIAKRTAHFPNEPKNSARKIYDSLPIGGGFHWHQSQNCRHYALLQRG
jgi:hypothetical protein